MDPQRLDFSYDIIWEGRWHVGSGYQSAAADRLLRRFGGVDGVPFVPGSQIKGVLRYQCEQLALALGFEAINPHDGIREDNQKLITHFTPLAKSTLIVDRLFGTRYQGECLYVTNAEPNDKTATAVKTRTAMDRLTGTVMEQHLFTTEIAEGHRNLKGSIRARHPAGVLTQYKDEFPYEYVFLLVSLLSLDRLGGDKSTGLGRCKIQIQEDTLLWNREQFSLDEVLQSFTDEHDDWCVMLEMLCEEAQREENTCNSKNTCPDSP